MDIQDRNTLDDIYRNLVNKRESIEDLLESIDDDFFKLENILYILHDEGWNPSDLFMED